MQCIFMKVQNMFTCEYKSIRKTLTGSQTNQEASLIYEDGIVGAEEGNTSGGSLTTVGTSPTPPGISLAPVGVLLTSTGVSLSTPRLASPQSPNVRLLAGNTIVALEVLGARDGDCGRRTSLICTYNPSETHIPAVTIRNISSFLH